MRARSNLALFLGVQTVYVALLAAIGRASLGVGVTMLVVAAFLTVPMLPIYLVVVAQIPLRWPPRRQRLAAVAASPLLLTLFGVVLGAWIAPTGLFLLLAAIPGAIVYGALVRLARAPRAGGPVVNA
jgi:hypothetical protein